MAGCDSRPEASRLRIDTSPWRIPTTYKRGHVHGSSGGDDNDTGDDGDDDDSFERPLHPLYYPRPREHVDFFHQRTTSEDAVDDDRDSVAVADSPLELAFSEQDEETEGNSSTRLDQQFVGTRDFASSLGTGSRSRSPLRDESWNEDTNTQHLHRHRHRRSITFNPKVLLDNGGEHGIQEPLPRPPELSTRPRGRSILQEMAQGKSDRRKTRTHSETDRDKYHPLTGELLGLPQSRQDHTAYRVGESRHPFLQSTVDALAEDDAARTSSLTSASTISPEFEPTKSPQQLPQQYTLPQRYALPIQSSSSPIELPALSGSVPMLSPRQSVQRSMSHVFDRSGSSRRISRRTSGRSTSSSMSPASAFLGQWARDEAQTPAAEPDDEGQEIGDHSGYIIGRQVGYGGFSVVKEVFTMQNTGRVTLAVKIVRKQVGGKSESENDVLQADFEHEVSIWRYLKHPRILPLIAVFDTPFATFCITQLNHGGTLFDLVRSQRKGVGRNQAVSTSVSTKKGLPLQLAKRYIYQLACAIRYLHQDVRIVHRDVKLENCLVDTASLSAPTGAGNLLLCDFGMSDFISRDDRDDLPHSVDRSAGNCDDDGKGGIGSSATSTSIAGSLAYASPELIQALGPLYEPSTDIWAFGVVCHALLVGDLPFSHSFLPKLQMMILAGDWDRDALSASLSECEESQSDSAAAVELVDACLNMEPRQRWSISDVLECRFLQAEHEDYQMTG